jgi:hypothetical protein
MNFVALEAILSVTFYSSPNSIVEDLPRKVVSYSAGQEILCCYETERFIAIFPKACHWFYPESFEVSQHLHTFISLRSILILSSYGPLLLSSSNQNFVCSSYFSLASSSRFDHPNSFMLRVEIINKLII